MKVHLIVLLIVIGTALFVPVVSAKIVEEKDGYVITTYDKPLVTSLSLFSSSVITQGQTDLYTTYVPSGKTALSPSLYWGTLSNSLSLTIVAPDSQLGPYYDSSDGVTDGRINLRITRTGGISPGTWRSYVYGYQVSGSQSYSYSAAAS